MQKNHIIITTSIALTIMAGSLIYVANAGYLDKYLKKEKPRAVVARAENQPISKKTSDNMANMPGMNINTSSSELPAVTVPSNLPTINIPYDKQQLIGVQTGTASIGSMLKQIRTVGRVTYDEKKLATINTKFDGYIEKLYVNTTGEYVKKGQPVAEIYSPELLATQMEFINLLKWRNKGQAATSQKDAKNDDLTGMLNADAANIIEAAKQRLRLFGISEEQINEVEKTGQAKRTLTVYSPAKGFVIQRQALQGTRVQPGQALFDVADLSTVWILADIYEQDLSLIREGQKATINFPYYPGKTFIASVNYVYPTLDSTTRTAKVRITLPNSSGILKPQMYSDVEISIGFGDRLAVPESAVINTGTRQIVYVDRGNGNFLQRQIKTGQRANGMVQILSGLKAGEIVSISANFLIDSEARLKGGAQ